LRTTFIAAALLGTSAVAAAQSPIIGFDVRQNRMISTDTANFVANLQVVVAPAPIRSFAIDFDASATNLWFVEAPTTAQPPLYGTVDPVTGVLNTLGTLNGGMLGATGLTAHPDGVTWYLTENVGTTMNLYRGNIATGTLTLVGSDATGGIIIDISCDSQGRLIAHSITSDSFYSVDPNTAALTLIGAHGLAANFAQGMDFDWTNDTLYAAIYTGGGTGRFVSVNTTTGAVTTLADTTPTNGEFEIAVQIPTGGGLGSNYCTAVPNSTGNTAVIGATGSLVASNNNVTLATTQMPNNAFGFYLTSTQQGFIANPGGSAGNLCLSGAIGRYVGPGQIKNSGATGSFSLVLNLNQTPQPSGTVAIAAGQTWNFTTWYRDVVGGTATSNFSNGLSVTFQ